MHVARAREKEREREREAYSVQKFDSARNRRMERLRSSILRIEGRSVECFALFILISSFAAAQLLSRSGSRQSLDWRNWSVSVLVSCCFDRLEICIVVRPTVSRFAFICEPPIKDQLKKSEDVERRWKIRAAALRDALISSPASRCHQQRLHNSLHKWRNSRGDWQEVSPKRDREIGRGKSGSCAIFAFYRSLAFYISLLSGSLLSDFYPLLSSMSTVQTNIRRRHVRYVTVLRDNRVDSRGEAASHY